MRRFSSWLSTVGTALGLVSRRPLIFLVAPDGGLLFTWVVVTVLALAAGGPLVGGSVLMGGLTLVFLLMLAAAAYMPPSRPFRELSALTARVADMVKVVTGAALFGAAAAYGGVVGAMMSAMPLNQTVSAALTWSIVWPVLATASIVGASVVGIRLGWDFFRSDHRTRLLALGRLRSHIPDRVARRCRFVRWLAAIATTGSRTGAFMIIGYMAPVIVTADIALGVEFVKLSS